MQDNSSDYIFKAYITSQIHSLCAEPCSRYAMTPFRASDQCHAVEQV